MGVVEDLERLVAFPTISDRPVTELAAWLATRLEDLDFRIERFEDDEPGKLNLVASIGPERDDAEGLVLSGHMDVVPTEGQPWTSDPFVLTERDGRLHGRGSADMKGFFAATLQALARIDRYERPLVLVWTHDEEVGCLGSAKLARKLTGRPLPSQCLIGEPTDFRILRMHPGHVGFEVELTGAAAHSSRPDLGINAIEAAADVVSAIRGIARELEPDGVPVNVARIAGGSAINIVPDRCIVQVGYRPPPGMASEAVFERVSAALARMDPRAGCEARLLRITPSLLTPENTPLEALLAPHASAPGTHSASFATDGGNLADLGMQPLVFGPGSIEVAHQADEFVPVDALHQAVDIIEQVVRARCV